MKICRMTSTYKLADGDSNVPFLVEANRQLKALGADVHVFAPSYRGLRSQVLDGVPVYRFRYFIRRWEDLTHNQGAPNRLRNSWYLLVAPFYVIAGLIHAVHFCRKSRFDVIHVHWPFPHGIWGYAAGRASGTPVVLNFHGAELLLVHKYPFVKPFLRHALRHADAVICNSRYTASEVAKYHDRPVAIIPSGPSVVSQNGTAKPENQVLQVLFVGRLVARKGVDILLRALPLVQADRPVHLHIVGNGDMAERWKALARSLDIESQVTFHGSVSKETLAQRYASADVFVLPAIIDERGDTEGLGAVLVEALSFSTPVVASNVGGIPDVIRDGETGLLVPEKDPPALAAAITRLLRDRDLASRLAKQGLSHAQDGFDWRRIAMQVMRVYQEVTGRATDRPEGLSPGRLQW
jgi:glycosyltransferase involved in cell wall biosynthesis